MGVGVKGYDYKGWVVAYGWDPIKAWNIYTASNPDRPGVTATFTSPREANQWIDKQGNIKPVARPVHRNQYGQRCARCGQWVAPGQGVILTWEEAKQQGLRLPIRPGYIVVHLVCPPKPEEKSCGLTIADPRLDEAWARLQEERWGKRPASDKGAEVNE